MILEPRFQRFLLSIRALQSYGVNMIHSAFLWLLKLMILRVDNFGNRDSMRSNVYGGHVLPAGITNSAFDADTAR